MAAASLVIDTSIVVKWYLPENGSEEASRIREECERTGTAIMMPELVRAELANAIWSHKQLKPEEKRGIVHHFLDMPFDIMPMEPELVQKAFDLACELDATVYDCMYLALAMLGGTRLITADIQFAKKASKYPIELLKASSAR
jgi:predicted nucleic acid-binding protein